MSRTIITGVDGSDTAAAAAHKAAELAQALDAELYVLCAYGKFEVEKFSEGSDEYILTTRDDAKRVAARAVLALRGEFPTLAVTSAPAEGKPGAALLEAAERLDADVIVVGNKRVQGISRLLGSIAREVASRALCDVYVAHTHQR